MRWLLIPSLVAALAAPAGADDKQSNPAFLGIGMADLKINPAHPRPGGNCVVTSVMRGSGARTAGLQTGDVLQQIETAKVVDCAAVLLAVQARQPGDMVTIVVDRDGTRLNLKPTLLSRDEILRRRLVGSPVMTAELYAVDGDGPATLTTRGRTTVVGWFSPSCVRCDEVFRKVASWSRKQSDKPGAPPLALAVTTEVDAPSAASSATYKRLGQTLDVPVALADPIVYEEFTLPDADRIQFTVIDCRGVVQYVAPVAPTSDDMAAALDEVFAAAEQVARQASKR